MGTLQPGVVLADRFRVEVAVPYAESKPAFLAIDRTTNAKLLVFDVEIGTAAALRSGVGVTHAHLATIAGIVGFGDVDVLMTEYVLGTTLDRFAAGSLSRVDAVRFMLRLLDALQALHHVGSPHGFVRPESVVLDPDGRGRPVLAFAPQPIPLSAYRSPERGEAGPPSLTDDAWAVGGVLHRMLTGRDPPAVGVVSEDELGAAGLDDPLLRAALAHALAAEPSRRNTDLLPLRRELARWFADHAGDERRESSASMRPPPPLPPTPASLRGPASAAFAPTAAPISIPPSAAAHGVSRSLPPRRARRAWVGALAAGAVIAGLGAAWLVSSLRAKPEVKVVTTAAATPPSAPLAIDISEVAVTGAADKADADRTVSCVSERLPKETFKKSPDLTWLCSETDARTAAERLRISIVQSGGGQTTAAMRAFSQLFWYDFAVLAVVRADCCPDAKALEFPEAGPGCEAMGPIVSDVAKAVNGNESYEQPLARFDKAARCEAGYKRSTVFRKNGPVGPGEVAAFKELVTRAP